MDIFSSVALLIGGTILLANFVAGVWHVMAQEEEQIR